MGRESSVILTEVRVRLLQEFALAKVIVSYVSISFLVLQSPSCLFKGPLVVDGIPRDEAF